MAQRQNAAHGDLAGQNVKPAGDKALALIEQGVAVLNLAGLKFGSFGFWPVASGSTLSMACDQV